MTTNPYTDKRTDFWKSYFEKALPFEDYVATGTETQQKKWKDYSDNLELSDFQKTLIESFTRQINILVLSGIWCGDCARQGPMLKCITKATSLFNLRFIDNKGHPELQEELRILGATRVPVVVSLSEDFFELNRFGDRSLSAYRIKAKNELGAACDAGLVMPPKAELDEELNEWLMHFERLQLMLRLAPMLRKRYED